MIITQIKLNIRLIFFSIDRKGLTLHEETSQNRYVTETLT